MRSQADAFVLPATLARPWRLVQERGAMLLAALVVGLFAVNALLHFPGTVNNDSINQYREAVSGRYSDWHPPVMAWLWSWLRYLGEGPGPLLLFHLALYWAGFGLLADAVRRAGHPAWALVVALAGAFPPFLYVNAQVVKDGGMAATWLAAAGVLFWYRSQQRRVPVLAGLAVAALLAYGTLVRGNAVFGLGPLLVYALAPASWWRSGRLMAAAVVVALLAIPASKLVNSGLLQAKSQHPEHSLFMFDLMGIAVHEGDPRLVEPRAKLSDADLHACYSPYWWDSLSPWGRCASRVDRPNKDLAANGDGLGQQWALTILEHPVAYAIHRLKHFNSSLLFLVPPKHLRFAPENRADDPTWKPFEAVTERDLKMDLVRKTFLVWPVTWLAWGLVLLVFLAHRATGTGIGFARVLVVSALAYSGAYLVVGVATDMRYHYWSLLAVMLATLLVLPQLAQGWRERSRILIGGLALVVLVVALGTAARLADWQALV